MRLRLGVLMWLLSWIPYGVVLGLSGDALTIAWALEITLGVVGLSLAGVEVAGAVKAAGWRKAPGIAWHTLLHGHAAEAGAVS